jgi:hypothetical protein
MDTEHMVQAAAVEPYTVRALDKIVLKEKNEIQRFPPRVSM